MRRARVLCEELVEADAVAVIFGACLAKSLNIEELFVLFQQLQIFVGDERGNSLTIAADERTFAGEHCLVDFGSEVVAEFFKSRDIGTSPVSGDSHDWFLSGVCPLAPRIVPV